ncbi:Renin Receptor [Manis pentadactyla]|nr:Renin Receptor [Manis pentadactyla]
MLLLGRIPLPTQRGDSDKVPPQRDVRSSCPRGCDGLFMCAQRGQLFFHGSVVIRSSHWPPPGKRNTEL